MKRYVIEVICSGNTARSPIAEVLGNNYLGGKNLADSIEVTSSGTKVNTEVNFKWTYKFISTAYGFPSNPFSADDKSIAENMFTDKNSSEMKFSSDPVYRSELKALASRSARFLVESEARFRDETLAKIGLRYNGQRKQTTYNPQTNLVLGMRGHHRDFAKNLYLKHPDVTIDTLSNYVGFGDVEVKGYFGISDAAVYDDLREIIDLYMKMAIEKFIDQIKKG